MTKPAEELEEMEGIVGVPPSEPPKDPLIGRTIDGRYLIENVLGEGGMGLVYRARHAVLQKLLAVKVLRPDVSKDEEIITRFRQEAQSASAIGNEHIISISDFGTLKDGSTYFVMEYLEGQDLTTAIEEAQPVPAGRAIHIARQLCDALGAAHAAGIVHRDLKPDNIYLVRRGQDDDFVKVLDFGIAKVGGGTRKLTKAGQVFGTPHYMSPEQCAGKSLDHRTDIYALGVILYEMATTQVPFDADNLMGVLTKHMYEAPVPPKELPELPVDCPPELEAVILKALQKDPDLRYQSMEELAEDLGRAGAGQLPAAVHDAVGRKSTTGVLARQTIHGGPAKKPWALWGGIAALVLTLLGVGGYLASGTGDDSDVAQAGASTNQPPQTPPEVIPEVAVPQASGATEPPDEGVETPDEVPPVTLITLTSSPDGVEVWQGESLVGNTPVEVERPQRGDTLDLELRRPRYENQAFRVSHLTQESVHITLQRARGRAVGGDRRQLGMATEPVMVTAPPPPMVTPMMSHTPSSEVLDPWAG